MTSFPGSPRLIKGNLVLLEPDTFQPKWTIALQYNPDTLSRTLQVQAVSDGVDRSEPLRLKAPPIETIKIDVEIDVTDQLSEGRTTEQGIHPELAALEAIIYPESSSLLRNNQLASSGQLEIIPVEAPFCLFSW